jgi:hypothetical protein
MSYGQLGASDMPINCPVSFQAGLNIGDMLLAVNKDSLLGCNYDTAASMLKKTEGIVVLTVCNPNKKDSKDKDSEAVIEVNPKDPSRPVTPKPQPSPAKEVPADPTTCEIVANQNTFIELKLDNQPIGIQVAGGCDTLVNVSVQLVSESITLMARLGDFTFFMFLLSLFVCP